MLDAELFGCISALIGVTYLTVNSRLDALWAVLWGTQQQEEEKGRLRRGSGAVHAGSSPSRALAEDLLSTYSYVAAWCKVNLLPSSAARVEFCAACSLLACMADCRLLTHTFLYSGARSVGGFQL